MKKILCALVGVFLFASSSFSQGILTATSVFKEVSEFYGTVRSYEADVNIKIGKTSMTGKVSFKRPNLLRIDFSDPAEQVICFNGDLLTIYLPGSAAILNQSVDSKSSDGSVNLATPQGLALMSRYYTVAWETGSDALPLDENSDERVLKFVLSRRTTSEAFRYIKLAVSSDTKLIRRIEAVTPQNETYVFDFKNYALNRDIPDNRFIYDPPTSANNYNNFLFSE